LRIRHGQMQVRGALLDSNSSGFTVKNMAADFDRLLEDALTLSEKERAQLAQLLLDSLEPEPTDEVRKAWDEEIARRVKEMDDGIDPGIPAEEVLAKLRAKSQRRDAARLA